MNDTSLTQAARASTGSLTRGVHHLALCTEDMKTTVEFYTRVLGMPLVHAMRTPPGTGVGPLNRGNPPYEQIRHYFFDMGNDSLLAFFEIPKGQGAVGAQSQRHRRNAALRLRRHSVTLSRDRGTPEDA